MDILLKLDADRLLQALDAAPRKTVRQMRLALREAMADVQKQAKEQHRFKARTGRLERSVNTRVADAATGVVFLNENTAPYAPFVHRGTRAHIIEPRKKKLLRWVNRRGQWRSSYLVHHPGTKPDPFLHEAANSQRGKINAIFAKRAALALFEAGLLTQEGR